MTTTTVSAAAQAQVAAVKAEICARLNVQPYDDILISPLLGMANMGEWLDESAADIPDCMTTPACDLLDMWLDMRAESPKGIQPYEDRWCYTHNWKVNRRGLPSRSKIEFTFDPLFRCWSLHTDKGMVLNVDNMVEGGLADAVAEAESWLNKARIETAPTLTGLLNAYRVAENREAASTWAKEDAEINDRLGVEPKPDPLQPLLDLETIRREKMATIDRLLNAKITANTVWKDAYELASNLRQREQSLRNMLDQLESPVDIREMFDVRQRRAAAELAATAAEAAWEAAKAAHAQALAEFHAGVKAMLAAIDAEMGKRAEPTL